MDPFRFGLVGDFIAKGENVGPKQAKWFQSGKRQTTSEHRKRRSKKAEIGYRGSLDDGKHPSKCKWF
jgi:hypothetical protein